MSVASRPQVRDSTCHPSVLLHPGHMFASGQPAAVTTILGSCVAVCLWNSARRIGGVCHYVLPHRVGQGHGSPQFGSVAIARLVEALEDLGSKCEHLQARIFGGASITLEARHNPSHLGARNVQVARKLLETEGIPVVEADVGGPRARKLVFHTGSGTAWTEDI